MCAAGLLTSDSALTNCLASPLCTSSGSSNAAIDSSRAEAPLSSSLSSSLSAFFSSPSTSSASSSSARGPAILLFLVLDARYVRPAYANGRERDAFYREYSRASQLLTSLRAVKTTLPVYIVVGGTMLESSDKQYALRARFKLAKLQALGARLVHVRPVPPPHWANENYRNNFNKLLALNLTQFSRVIVLDNDCVALRNIDHLAWRVPTPAAACHPRRGFQLCSFNFGVHVLTPSARAAAELFGSFTTRKKANNGGEQEVWANFHHRIHELPVAYNTHRGLTLNESDWRRVYVLHMVSGYSTNRMPPWLSERIKTYR